jgi:hypothetical protein
MWTFLKWIWDVVCRSVFLLLLPQLISFERYGFVDVGHFPKSNSKLYYDRQSVGESVLVSGTHQGPATNFSPSFFNYFLNSYACIDVGRPPLQEVESVVFSYCWASPAQFFSSLSPTGLMSILYCLCFWDSPNLEGQVPAFIFPRNRVAQKYPRALLKLKLSYDRRSIGQSILVPGSYPEPTTKFFLCICNCEFLDEWLSVWWEDGSAIYSYNCFRALSEQSLSGPSPADLTTLFTVSYETPPTWRARFPYLYPPGVWWSRYIPEH